MVTKLVLSIILSLFKAEYCRSAALTFLNCFLGGFNYCIRGSFTILLKAWCNHINFVPLWKLVGKRNFYRLSYSCRPQKDTSLTKNDRKEDYDIRHTKFYSSVSRDELTSVNKNVAFTQGNLRHGKGIFSFLLLNRSRQMRFIRRNLNRIVFKLLTLFFTLPSLPH